MKIYLLVVVLVAGIACGRIIPADFDAEFASQWVLALLLVVIGVLLGADKRALAAIRQVGLRFLLVPLAIAAGSVAGAIVFWPLSGLSTGEAAAVGAGFGWYSLSSVMLANMGLPTAGAIALLSNVMRELIALSTIPLIARRIGAIHTLAPAGATSMDVTLPIIVRSAGASMGLLAFASGALLSLLVPVLVPLFAGR